jgi:hypothetical protein
MTTSPTSSSSTPSTVARDSWRADRFKAIGWLTIGAAATAALAATGLWLIGGHPATPTVSPGPSTSEHATTSSPTPPHGQNQATTSGPATPGREATPTTQPTPSPATQGDPMAGAITDSMIQQTLDDAGLTTVNQHTAKTTRAVAWTALAADLQAGGWGHPRLQAFAATAPGSNQTTPTLVDVTVIWSATDPAGQPVDRQRSTVRLTLTAGKWTVARIT